MQSRGHRLLMADRTRRGLTLSWLVLFVLSLMLQYGALANPSSTLAVHDEGLFELDGNVANDAAVAGNDWDQVYNGTSSADSTVFVTDLVNDQADDTFKGSTGDDQAISDWGWVTAKASQQKNDIAHAYAAAYTQTTGDNAGHTFAYFGLDKWAPNGDNYAGFWFFKGSVSPSGDGSTASGDPFSGSHQVGDILVLADYTNGGAVAAFSVYTWVGSGGDVGPAHTLQTVATGVPCTGAPATDFACGATNGANVTSPWSFQSAGSGDPANTFTPSEFFEGGIDLTALGLDQGCFTSFLAETRSSQQVTATLSDFAGGSFSFCVTPSLSTQVSGSSITIGSGTVTDTAHLSSTKGVPTGTVDFFLCGPTGSAADCATGGTDAGASKAVNGSGDASSDAMSPTTPGWYCFRAEYTPSDGSKYLPETHTNATTECFQVLKASPAIATSADQTVSAGNAISDSATLSGGYNPTGTITFRAYGPDDANCSGTAAYTSTAVTVNGNGTYGPVSFMPSAAGTYRWIASYSGDANNNSVAGACNDTGETDTVNKVSPTIATSANQSVLIGASIADSATLSGGVVPTGTITFRAYGPNDATCANAAVFTSSPVTVNGNGTYGPVSFTPTAVGTYHWIASYSGDANNNSAAGSCGDTGENDTVSPQSPQISTTASAGVPVGGDISDTAHLTGGYSPTGTISFALYGPDDATCAGDPIFTDSVSVNGNGDYPSAAFTATAAGTYRWIATYSGDANNNAIGGACNDADESVVVTKLSPSISTVLTDGQTSGTNLTFPLGTSVSDSATLAGATPDAGGTVTYTVYADASCQTPFADAGTATVTDGIVGASDPVTFNDAGTYYWQAAYSGDANNDAATSACTDEVVKIVPNLVTINTSLSGQGHEGSEITVQVHNAVTDSAVLTGETATAGGTVTYTVYSDATCSTVVADGGTKNVVNGNVPDSDPVTFDANGTYYWQAAYSGDANNEAATSDCLEEIVHVVSPSIGILKTVDDADHVVGQGQLLTYSLALTVVNGPVTQSVVSDPLPVGQEFVSASDGGTFDNATRTINWDLGTLQSGDPVMVLTYQVTVAADAQPGDEPNTATFDTNETPPTDSSELVTVPDVSIVKDNDDADGVVGPGQAVTYTLDVTVTDGPVTNAVVTDTLPAGQTYTPGSQTSDPAATFAVLDGGTTLQWTWSSLTTGAHITYQVTIDTDAPVGLQTNTAEVCVSELTACKPSDSSVAVPALVIDKAYTGNTAGTLSNGLRLANVGDTLTYTLSYDLTGGPVHDGVITDTIPAGLTYVDGSATNSDEFSFVSYDAASRTLTWTAPLVSKDDTVSYQVTVDEGAFDLAQPLVNVATIDSDETAPDDADADVGVQAVEAATATPTVTLPPTDTINRGQAPSNPGFGLTLALLAIAGLGLVTGYVTPTVGRSRREGIRRR